MRTVYLIRHGEVDFGGKRRCIGTTDLPMSEQGKCQAAELSTFFNDRGLSAIYTSPAERARLTAEILSRGRWPIAACDSLAEIDMGKWEGLTFSEIKEKFPELYEQRGQNPECFAPPDGETLAAGQTRAAGAMQQILSNTTGDIAIVAHSGINRLLICMYKGIALTEWMTIPQPYGCVNILQIGESSIAVDETGRMPRDAPNDEECFRLLHKRQTPQPVIDHCRAVAGKAEEIAAVLIGRGIPLNRELVRAGALLHDIARVQPRHAQAAALWIIAEGYPKVAKVIAEHEELPEPAHLDESAVVYMADKLILGTEEVTMEERFSRSLEKCRDEPARLAHEKRFQQALWLREQIFSAGAYK